LLHLQDRDALLEASSSAAQAPYASTVAVAELPTSSAGPEAPAQNSTAAAHHDSVDSAQAVQIALEAISNTSGEENRAQQPAAHQQHHHADHVASNSVGQALTPAIYGEDVPSATALPLVAPQKQLQQRQSAGPLQGDFLAELLAFSYTRHDPGTGDMRHDTEGWRYLETSFKVQRLACLAVLPSLASFSAVKGCAWIFVLLATCH